MRAILNTNLLVAESHGPAARIARAGIPFDDAAADAYATVCGLVLAHGRGVRGRVIDLMIAATAAAHGAAVLTRNTDDFAGLEGLVPIVAA